MMKPAEVARLAIEALDNKKGADIKLLRTTNVTTLADYFIICKATSSTHIRTLSDEVERVLKENGELPMRREGHRAGDWLLLDYSCVIVHVFMKDARDFYTLERLWADAEIINIERTSLGKL